MDYGFSRESRTLDKAQPLPPLEWAELRAKLDAAQAELAQAAPGEALQTPLKADTSEPDAVSFHDATAAMLRKEQEL